MKVLHEPSCGIEAANTWVNKGLQHTIVVKRRFCDNLPLSLIKMINSHRLVNIPVTYTIQPGVENNERE